MNHKLYEKLLFSEEPLNEVQTRALRDHLVSCASCRKLSRSWVMVRQLFHNDSPVTPIPGFVARWQARLDADIVEEKSKRQHRLPWMVFAINSCAAAVLLWLLGFLLLSGVETPLQLFLGGIYRFTALLSITSALIDFGAIFFRLVFWQLPLVYWAALAAGLGLLNLLWIVSLRQVFNIRRVTR